MIDWHRSLVGDGVLDVEEGDVIAEDHPRVRVRILDGCAGERRIRQSKIITSQRQTAMLPALFDDRPHASYEFLCCRNSPRFQFSLITGAG